MISPTIHNKYFFSVLQLYLVSYKLYICRTKYVTWNDPCWPNVPWSFYTCSAWSSVRTWARKLLFTCGPLSSQGRLSVNGRVLFVPDMSSIIHKLTVSPCCSDFIPVRNIGSVGFYCVLFTCIFTIKANNWKSSYSLKKCDTANGLIRVRTSILCSYLNKHVRV